jgi:hypothetical protein
MNTEQQDALSLAVRVMFAGPAAYVRSAGHLAMAVSGPEETPAT